MNPRQACRNSVRTRYRVALLYNPGVIIVALRARAYCSTVAVPGRAGEVNFVEKHTVHNNLPGWKPGPAKSEVPLPGDTKTKITEKKKSTTLVRTYYLFNLNCTYIYYILYSIYISLCATLGNPIQNAIDLCTPRQMREEKGEQKSSENTRIAIFVFRIYKLGYGTFQEIFLENVATFFFFAKLRSARGPSGAPLGPRGPRPPARIGSKASWQIALRPHKCKYTWVVASGVRKNIL